MKFRRLNFNIDWIQGVLLIFCTLLIQSCDREDPTVFSGDVVDTVTGNSIPEVTLLVSVYQKTPWLTVPGIIRQDTIETDSKGYFNLFVPYDEQFSRFTINVLKKGAYDTYEFVNAEIDCSPYNCSSFRSGRAYKFELKIPLDSL